MIKSKKELTVAIKLAKKYPDIFTLDDCGFGKYILTVLDVNKLTKLLKKAK